MNYLGAIKIILVGVLWIICMIIPLRQWVRVLVFLIAVVYKPLRAYAHDQFMSDDQDMLAFIGGPEDHTISGHVGYMSMQGHPEYIQAEKVIDTIVFWQDNHCFKSIEWDEVYKDVNDSH